MSSRVGLFGCMFLIGCAGQSAPPPVVGELVFVRGGVIAPSGEGVTTPAGVIVAHPWKPGDTVEVGGLSSVAPARAACTRLFSVDLGDVSRLVAMGGAAPNSTLAFSPDGTKLAVGSYRGELLVLDAFTGDVLARKSLAETMVKEVDWSADGETLYAAEQSPDAMVYAMDPATLTPRWTLRLADFVGSSAPPPAEDLYGVYTLPGAYTQVVLPDGDLLVSALHSWDLDGVKTNRSQILRIGTDGTVTDRWPEEPADATFQHVAVDRAGGLIAVTINRSADGAPPTDLPVGGVMVLDLDTLTPMLPIMTEPLEPWFSYTFIWNGLAVSRADDAVFMGFGDGRARLLSLTGESRLELTTGAPILAGDVPIHASVGWGGISAGRLIYSTSTTLIPYGAASASLRPPTAHPGENTLWAVGLDGAAQWSWTGPQRIEGLSFAEDGRHLIVGAGDRKTDERRDLYGALVFSLTGADRSGEERLEAFCQTEGPVFFRHTLSADGRVAVAEHPYTDTDGTVKGHYQVTVLR
ncbi:MAG: WD40 repeat domain-containing protein [Myxococcota bacterium]|nr:WD40 repeat domain-containing protein [Myxococcota bacterium]